MKSEVGCESTQAARAETTTADVAMRAVRCADAATAAAVGAGVRCAVDAAADVQKRLAQAERSLDHAACQETKIENVVYLDSRAVDSEDQAE